MHIFATYMYLCWITKNNCAIKSNHSEWQNRMKPVDLESAMVLTDYLFSELNTSANLFFKKKYQNNKMDQWYRKPGTFINITCVC